ncbi:MAG: PH domain-containing protein [bacterium]|nr:PH domain-containing protein [bacterium]
MVTDLYKRVNRFLKTYPGTIAFRVKKHCEVVEKHLDTDEKIIYAFVGQKNEHWYDIVSTHVFVLTNKRLIIATKRIVFGYFLYSITPDMFNDLTVYSGLFFGRIVIDTVKELVYITNLSKKSLDEIETNISSYMMEEKKKYTKGTNN